MGKNLLNVGIIGTGFIVKKSHIPGFAKSDKFVVKGLYDIKKENAEDAKKQYLKLLKKNKNHDVLKIAEKETRIYESLGEMITDVDVVDICTPPKYHVNNLKMALDAEKHVICEKPLARNWWTAHDLDITKFGGDLKFQLHTQGIWNPLIEKGKKLLVDGIVGDIQKIRILHQGADPKHTVKLGALWDKVHSGGGALTDIGPHAFASMWYWLGDGWSPKSVKANLVEATKPVRKIAGVPDTKVEVEDDAHITITWKNDDGKEITGELEATWNKKNWFPDGKSKGSSLAPDLYYEVQGTKGTFSFPHVIFSLSNPFGLAVAFKVIRPDGTKEMIKNPLPPGGIEDFIFFDEFGNVINDDSIESRNSLEFSIDMLTIFGAAYLSRKKGGEVVSIDDFKQHATNIGSKHDNPSDATEAIIVDLFEGF